MKYLEVTSLYPAQHRGELPMTLIWMSVFAHAQPDQMGHHAAIKQPLFYTLD